MATDLEEMAQLIAGQGFRVLVHDRLNSGRSSIDFNRTEGEEEGFVKDLAALLQHVGVKTAFIAGRSSGSRIALHFALAYPEIVRGLFLWGISSGPLPLRFLNSYYFGTNLRACNKGGMEAVCALEHFSMMIDVNAENRNTLMSIDPEHFKKVMLTWKSDFAVNANLPVMGITDDQLASINVPTLIMPFFDYLHPISAVEHAHRKIPESTLISFIETQKPLSQLQSTAADKFCQFMTS